MKWIPVVGLVLFLTGCSLFGGDNHPPEFTTTPDTVGVVGAEYVYEAHATDADGDDVRLEVVETPFWLSSEAVQENRLTLRGTPARRHAGTHSIELRASDGNEATLQTYALRVEYDFAGEYLASSFTYFEAGCGDTYDALTRGGFFAVSVDPFGRFDAEWEPGLGADPVTATSFSGTYTVSGDVLTMKGINEEFAASIWNDAQFRIEPPRLRQVSTIPCGARVTLERRG